MTSCDCDLAVGGAGLAGTTLLASLRLAGWLGSARVLEAGRGPGGRASTRLRRDNPHWHLDHGAPVLYLQSGGGGALADDKGVARYGKGGALYKAKNRK